SGNSGYYINNKQIMDGEGVIQTKSFNIPKDYDAATRRADGKFNQQFAPVNAKQSKNDIGAHDYKGYTLNGKMIADKDGKLTGKVFDMEIANDMSPHHIPVSDNIRTSSKDNEDWTINKDQKRESEEEQFKIPQDYKADKRRDNGKYSTIYKPKHAAQSPNDMGNVNYKGYIINDKTIIDMKENIKTPLFDMKDETNISPHKPISDNIATSGQDRASWRINNSQSAGEQFDMKLVNQELPKPMSSNIKTSTVDKPLATPVTWPPTRRALMAQALSKK
ncbi:MAG: hypothetical protein K6F77_08280, partial [Lachnospiraceae bacterium]|nr:hypothetical protein [Lachnospiraceae bacterium]